MDGSCDNSLIRSRDDKSKKDVFPHQETNDDWFTQSTKSIFEEPPLVPEPTKDEKHEMTKQEILSQFDVFTELDPLGKRIFIIFNKISMTHFFYFEEYLQIVQNISFTYAIRYMCGGSRYSRGNFFFISLSILFRCVVPKFTTQTKNKIKKIYCFLMFLISQGLLT